MKVDVTTIFFNSVIPDATATAPWCVSIGQGKEKKINASIDGLQDVLDGLIYKAVRDHDLVDLSAGSKNNEYLLISKFDKVFVNGSQINNLQMIVTLVREHTKSHEGRLRISLPPYAKYDDGETSFSNEQSYQLISDFLGCGNIFNGGCWFIDDISVLDQDELHFSCVIVNQNERMSYKTSQLRSAEWQQLVPEEHNYVRVTLPIVTDESLQLIYYGAPGTGKSFTIDRFTNENNSVRTTFHPDSDYAGFVGAYKPTMQSVDIHYISDGEVKYAKGGNNDKTTKGIHPGKERKIVYKYVPQAFLKAYVEAWKRYAAGEDNPYYLVIEEINRGNCAQIFGDLFQLLDRNNMGCSSYAISADEDIAQFLREDEKGFSLKKTEDSEGLTQEQRDVIAAFVLKKDGEEEEHIGDAILNGSKLLLPPNLRIWATMNTSDQSLFPIDSAFKRRWNWEYMPIEYDPVDKKTDEHLSWKLEIGGKTYSWGKFLEIINKEIEDVTVSEDKQMGYFFAKPDKKSKEVLTKNDTISEKVFVNKVLFYLWTDVFKDYDLTKKPFIHEVKDNDGKHVNKPFSFRNFFPIDKNTCLADFMSNLVEMGLNPLDGNVDIDTTGENNNTEGNFSVNGIPVRWQNGVPAEAVREYIKAFPDKSATEVIQDWRSLGGPLVSHFIETKAENEARTDKDKTYVVSIDCNGEPLFVSKQGWGDNRPNGSYYALLNMVNAIKTKGWPIEIKGVE